MLKFTKIVKKEIRKKPILTTCLVGSSITRLLSVLFSTYLILWIQHFKGFETGSKSKDVYFNMMMISVAISSIVLPIMGKYIDKAPAIRIVPYAFMARCACTYMFYLLKAPDSYYAYSVCVLIIIFTILESNLIDSIYSKSLEKSTRGLMYGMQMFMCNLALLIYSVLSGWLVDNIGTKAPFIAIGMVDALYAMLVWVQICKYGWGE